MSIQIWSVIPEFGRQAHRTWSRILSSCRAYFRLNSELDRVQQEDSMFRSREPNSVSDTTNHLLGTLNSEFFNGLSYFNVSTSA